MSVLTIQAKAVVGLVAIGLLAGSFFWFYEKGKSHGEDNIQTKWNQEKNLQATAMNLLKDQYAVLEAANRKKTEDLTHDLAQAQQTHALAMDSAQSDFDKRLLQSNKRADLYKRQTETGTTECRAIASHAAELDRSLEEGRSVVAELSATLRLRDSQLIALGAKLLADRQLITGVDNGSTDSATTK